GNSKACSGIRILRIPIHEHVSESHEGEREVKKSIISENSDVLNGIMTEFPEIIEFSLN
ncbi:hypothetical protein NPIL_684821, partial [Nephila pilipes]